MNKETLAILSVSAGAGHVRAAEAVKVTAEKEFPSLNPVHIDVMTLVSDLFKKLYADSYLSIVEKHPSLWGYLYKKADQEKAESMLNKLRRGIEKLNTKKLVSTLEELKPSKILCTHFLPAELLSRMSLNGTYHKPIWVQVTDFDIHTMWVHQGITGYFAASEEVAWRMADRGIPLNLITVTGIPIMPVFAQKFSRKECAAEYSLDPQKTTIVMMSGGYGVGGIDLLAERLLKIEGDFQIIALAGRNEKLLETLKELGSKHPNRLFPQGFTRTIERLMACADFAVTKPGGLTSSECLAMGLPMIVVSPIPGQEERNADYLLENGVALKAYDGAGLEYRVKTLLKNPRRIMEMRERALKIAKPHAANKVLETITAE